MPKVEMEPGNVKEERLKAQIVNLVIDIGEISCLLPRNFKNGVSNEFNHYLDVCVLGNGQSQGLNAGHCTFYDIYE